MHLWWWYQFFPLHFFLYFHLITWSRKYKSNTKLYKTTMHEMINNRGARELVTTIKGFQRRALLQVGWLSNTLVSFHAFIQCIVQVASCCHASLSAVFPKRDNLMLLQQLSNSLPPPHTCWFSIHVALAVMYKMAQILLVFLNLRHTMNICLFAHPHPHVWSIFLTSLDNCHYSRSHSSCALYKLG